MELSEKMKRSRPKEIKYSIDSRWGGGAGGGGG